MTNDVPPERRLLSVREVQVVLGLSEWTVKQLIHSGTLLSVKIHDRRLVPREAIEAYIQGLIAEAKGAPLGNHKHV
jgi:excisionase family DNA binding protein